MSTFRQQFVVIGSLCLLALAGSVAVAADESFSEEALYEVESAMDHAAGVDPDETHHHVPGEPDYDQPPLVFDVEMFVFTLVLFGLFIFVMRSTVWMPLMKALNNREGRIVNAEAEARATRLEVEKLTAQAETRLEEVYGEVKTIIAQARAAAEAKKLEIVTQAEEDAQRIKREALAEIEQARVQAIQELDQTIEDQVALATEHVGGRRL